MTGVRDEENQRKDVTRSFCPEFAIDALACGSELGVLELFVQYGEKDRGGNVARE